MKKFLLLIAFCSNAAFAQQMVKAGTIYSEHPYIIVVKRFARQYGQVNPDDMAQLYADTVHFYGMTRYNADTSRLAKNLPLKGQPIGEAKKGWMDIISNWQDVKMTLIGQPEGYEYYRNPVFVVQSRWLLTMTNKKTKKTAYLELQLFDEFNDAGKIAVQREYYDPTPLLIAMRP
ncbi:MAG: hypothetical protein JST19_20745 [Bacteroidetes bacterium]|nr:hypothetical protein [Bacteroidota bacterium]